MSCRSARVIARPMTAVRGESRRRTTTTMTGRHLRPGRLATGPLARGRLPRSLRPLSRRRRPLWQTHRAARSRTRNGQIRPTRRLEEERARTTGGTRLPVLGRRRQQRRRRGHQTCTARRRRAVSLTARPTAIGASSSHAQPRIPFDPDGLTPPSHQQPDEQGPRLGLVPPPSFEPGYRGRRARDQARGDG